MNTVTLIGERSGRLWPQVLQWAEQSLREGRRLVVYVPEQATLQTERDLIADLGLPGLLNLQVISPRKLRQQVRERMGSGARRSLTEAGRAMAVHRVMTEKAEELLFFRHLADYPGAVKKVGEALSELRESELTSGELAGYAAQAQTGAERARLNDLGVIWQGYEELTAPRFDDEKAAWTDMVRRLTAGRLWQDVNLAVYGFDTVRPDLRELLTGVCAQANSIRVFLTMDAPGAPDGRIFAQQHQSARSLAQALEAAGGRLDCVYPGLAREGSPASLRHLERFLFARDACPFEGEADEALSLYAGATPWAETEHIVATLRRWHEAGMPWRRMAVALPGKDGLGSVLRAALRMNGIPFHDQQKDRAADHPVCRMLIAAVSCLSDGYRTERVMEIARSGFCILSPEEGLALEDEARARGVEGRRWLQPFRARGAETAEPPAAEGLRQKLIGPLETLRRRLREARDATASVEALVDFLEEEQVWARLREEEEELLHRQLYREAVVNRQIWKLLMEILEQLWLLLDGRRAAIRDLKHLLTSALSGAEVAAPPEQQTGVAVGEVGHLLAGAVDGLVLAGLQDGALSQGPVGWLTDEERRRLEESTGKTVGLSREENGLIRKYDFYRTVTLPRQRLLISWSLQGEDGGALQPDPLAYQLRELFPRLRVSGGLQEKEAEALPPTAPAALNGLGVRLEAVRRGEAEDLSPVWKTALISLLHHDRHRDAARRLLLSVLPREERRRIREETARRLFMTRQLSVSRLEQFAACPYRHFVDYGLRPVEQETFTFAINEAGSFFHEAIDRYLKEAGTLPDWPRLTEERAAGLIDAILSDLTEDWEDGPLRRDALGVWEGEGYLRRVRRAAQVLTRFAANSDFRVLATEQAFGVPEGLPAVVIPLRDGSRAALRGRIDRLDAYENGEGVWLRIIDNKSSAKQLEPTRFAAGEQLQLLIYLKAASRALPGARLAGAFYFPVLDKEVDTKEDEPEQIEADRLKTVRLKGLMAAREDILRAMDREIHPYSVDRVFNKDGTVSKSVGWAVEEQALARLCDRAVEIAGDLCERIRSGEMDASPTSDGLGPVCRYCDYHSLCRVRRGSERTLDQTMTWQDVAGTDAREGTREAGPAEA